MTTGVDAAEKTKKLIEKIKPDLSINRVPPKTLAVFKELAKEEFCDDYGFALKWLVDNFINGAQYQALVERIEAIEKRLANLESKNVHTEYEERVLLSGRTIKTPKR